MWVLWDPVGRTTSAILEDLLNILGVVIHAVVALEHQYCVYELLLGVVVVDGPTG